MFPPATPSGRPLGALAWLVSAGLACLTGLGACNVPAANLSNLRAVHQADGSLSYRGNLHNGFSFVISRWVDTLPVSVSGVTDNPALLGGLDGDADPIENPAEVDLENLLALAAADSNDLLERGLQVEAFGWLAPDDQYVLGRERSVIELGRLARLLKVAEPLVEPEHAAGPEVLSGVLANLARAVLGNPDFAAELAVDGELASTPSGLQNVPAFGDAHAALAALELDRQGELRVLALCDALFLRDPGRLTANDDTSRALRALAVESQQRIVGLALADALEDKAPIVRAAAVQAVAGLAPGPPVGLLKLAATDPAWEVAHAGLAWVADHGLPLQRVPAELHDEARTEWEGFLVGQCQSPDARLSFSACRALVTAVPDGPGSLRSEDWTAWWRVTYPSRALPEPLVARVPPGVEP